MTEKRGSWTNRGLTEGIKGNVDVSSVFLFFFNTYIYFNLFVLFTYFWLRWIFVSVHGLLIAVASLVAEHGL